jgi:hypothetical protein
MHHHPRKGRHRLEMYQSGEWSILISAHADIEVGKAMVMELYAGVAFPDEDEDWVLF